MEWSHESDATSDIIGIGFFSIRKAILIASKPFLLAGVAFSISQGDWCKGWMQDFEHSRLIPGPSLLWISNLPLRNLDEWPKNFCPKTNILRTNFFSYRLGAEMVRTVNCTELKFFLYLAK